MKTYNVYRYNGTHTVRCEKALDSMPYAKCGVDTLNDGTIMFYSYETLVIVVSPTGWLECTGTYSQTTRKQIGRFMQEYFGLTYFHAKKCYENGEVLNVKTGEVKTIDEYKKVSGWE